MIDSLLIIICYFVYAIGGAVFYILLGTLIAILLRYVLFLVCFVLIKLCHFIRHLKDLITCLYLIRKNTVQKLK